MTDNDLDLVTRMPLLRYVDLHTAKLTPASLAKLSRLQKLKYLVAPMDINDDGLGMIALHAGLERLEFADDAQITGSGFRTLAKNRTITDLALARSVRDADVIELAAMTQLRSLRLWQKVTDACVPALCRLPNLETLTLHETPISADGFAQFQQARALRTINMYGVKLDDRKVAALAGLTQLTQLLIQQEKLTAEQLDTLTRALPNCEIKNINTGS